MDKQKLKEFISKLLAIDVKNLNEQQLAEHMAMVKQARSLAEGYTVTRGIDKERYQERQGLEGPFSTKSGKVVYYDKVEGKYYDPDTDMYIEYEDWQAMNEGNLERKELGNGRTQYIRKSSSYTDDGGSSIPSHSVNTPKRGVEDENEREFNFRDDDELDEAQEDTFVSALKGLKSWAVVIFNNYYAGKYSDYRGRYFLVLASSAEEAKQVVLDNADSILHDLLALKSHNGKKILPRGSAVRITPDRIGKIEDGTVAVRMSTAGYKKMYSPQGVMMVKLTNGAIVDVQGQEQGVAEGWDPDTTRLEQDVRDALENGDDYTAKQYAKMAPTPEAKKYLLNIIQQAMYLDDLGGETDWKGVAEGDPGYDKHSFIGKIRRSREADNKGWGQLGQQFAANSEEEYRKALRKGNRYYNMTRGDNKTPGGFPKTTVEAAEDTVRFVLHSERAYEAVMDRMGDLIDWDEFDYMKVPSRLWPKVQQIAADADGIGAENVDDNVEDNPEHYGVNEEISTEAYDRLKRVFDFSDYKG
jgi:hypothetical protein